MNRLVGHALILVAAAGGACVCLELIDLHRPRAHAGAAVIGSSPAPASSALIARPVPPSVDATPMDREYLARALQRELRRVGCYGGDINGAWGPQSRQAMSTFTDKIKVRLPIEAPDHMLLKLVQEQTQPVCAAADVTPVGKPSPPAAPERATAPIEPKLISPPIEVKRPPAKRPPNAERRSAKEEIANAEATAPRSGALIPRAAVYGAPPKTPEPGLQPPKFVRSLMQGVASALSTIDLP